MLDQCIALTLKASLIVTAHDESLFFGIRVCVLSFKLPLRLLFFRIKCAFVPPMPNPLTLMRLVWHAGQSVNLFGIAIFHFSSGISGLGVE